MELRLVLGDQLFEDDPAWATGLPIFMREDRGLATRVRHHRQKITLFFSAMRHFAANRHRVTYQRYDPLDDRPFVVALADHCHHHGIRKLHAYEPADAFMKSELESLDVDVVWRPNPMFLTDATAWNDFTRSTRRRLMADFYRYQRRRLGVLLEPDGAPLGGSWSFDDQNRKPLPAKVIPPPDSFVPPDAITREVIDLVDREFVDHPGRADLFGYPVSPAQARGWLDDFVRERLDRFGDYEDAMSRRSRMVFHSVLSPLLNVGLLTPRHVLDAVLRAEVPLNSKEGFVRQLIGWREFVYWIDREAPTQPPNHFGFTRGLGSAWWTAQTGLPPLDDVIRRCVDHAWAHHIERLMVVGATMLMCEADPTDAYRWFMEMFIDSADWVMRPNVFGMSQFADGGVFATKPYVSGSAYIRRMSDWPAGPWTETWDGLYWSFLERNREFLADSPRLALPYRSLDRLPAERRRRLAEVAGAFRDRVTVA